LCDGRFSVSAKETALSRSIGAFGLNLNEVGFPRCVAEGMVLKAKKVLTFWSADVPRNLSPWVMFGYVQSLLIL